MWSTMVEIHMEVDIEASAEEVFDAIADLRGYDRWLPHSSAFEGTTEISPGPIAAGTTYVEPGSTGVRNGTVAEFERPSRVTFDQPMTLKPQLLGTIGIRLRCTLTPEAGSVHVERDVTVDVPWRLKLAQPLVVRRIRTENERIMRALKTFAESHRQRPAG
jgi:uncharacterized protein YndB with AHSA1/START domain